MEKNIQDAEMALAKMKSEMKNATAERKQIQEKIRAALLTAAHGLRDPDKQEDNRTECNICLEEYNNDERKESVLHCCHRSCFKCLTDLPNKLCPICRKEFTAEQIIKFF